MKGLPKKRRLKAGESLVETLAAILVTALSAVIIANAISASAWLNVTVQGALDELNIEMSAAETGAGSRPGSVTVDGQEISVTFSGGGALTSYKGA